MVDVKKNRIGLEITPYRGQDHALRRLRP